MKVPSDDAVHLRREVRCIVSVMRTDYRRSHRQRPISVMVTLRRLYVRAGAKRKGEKSQSKNTQILFMVFARPYD
jgi:hypothetical protein